MGRGKHPRNQDSASRRAAAEAGLRARREANRERTTDHVGSVLERPRQIIAEAVLRGTGDRDAVENARNQVNAIRLAVEGDPDLYPSVTQERLDEMGKLIDQANEILDRSSERGQATEGGNVVNSRVSEKKKSRKERPAEVTALVKVGQAEGEKGPESDAAAKLLESYRELLRKAIDVKGEPVIKRGSVNRAIVEKARYEMDLIREAIAKNSDRFPYVAESTKQDIVDFIEGADRLLAESKAVEADQYTQGDKEVFRDSFVEKVKREQLFVQSVLGKKPVKLNFLRNAQRDLERLRDEIAEDAHGASLISKDERRDLYVFLEELKDNIEQLEAEQKTTEEKGKRTMTARQVADKEDARKRRDRLDAVYAAAGERHRAAMDGDEEEEAGKDVDFSGIALEIPWDRESLDEEGKQLLDWLNAAAQDLDSTMSRLEVLSPSPQQRQQLFIDLVAGKINEEHFNLKILSWRWKDEGGALSLQREQHRKQKEFLDQVRVFVLGLRELRGRLAEAKKKSVQKTKEPAPAPEATDVPKQSVEVAPAISVGAPKSTEKFRLELVEDELDDVSDRLQTAYALTEREEWWDENADQGEIVKLLQDVVTGKVSEEEALLSFKEEYAGEVRGMLKDLAANHARYLQLEAEMNALMRPHEESPGEVAARVVAEPQAVEVLKAVDSERVYSQKEVKQLLREMNKKIGNSFRARDAQRKMQKDTLVAELDVDGGLVSTTGERGLLGKRYGKEDKNKNEDNTFVREIRREQGREDKADPAAENREKLRAFTRAIVDFKNAIEELRQRVLNFDVDPDEDGLQSAYDLLRETEARAAAAFENIPAGSPGYDINKELAASAIRDQERVLVLLTSLREKQGVAAAEKTRERASSAEREAQDRALLESALDGLSAAQDSCGKEMARIQRLVVAGKQWNAENLNFAIQDVKDMKRNLGMTLKLVGDARIDDLMKRAEELEVTYRQLRERREELLRFIEEKEREAADATRQADEENTVELPVDEVAQDLTQAAIIPDAEKTQPVEKVSWLRRYAPNMRRFFSYLTSGWQEAKNLAQDSVELAGAQMTGALTSSERGEIELGNLSEGARLASSLLGNVVLTGTGTKFLVDLPRYVSQKHFAAGERERLTEELSEIVTKDKLDERERYQYARSEELARSIRNSRYLTKQQREEMLARLYAVDEAYRGERKEEDEEAKKAIAKIIEKAIKTRISGTRVVKEALNTALIMTGPAAFLLRPGAYGVVSLVERYQNVSEAEPDKAMADKMKQAFADGFGEWWQKIKGEVGDTRTKQELNRLAAIGTLARAFGVVGGALAETAMITSLLTAAGAPLLLGEGEGIVPEPIIKLTEKEPVLNDARIFVPEDAPSVGMGLEEDPDAFLAAVTGETPETPETFETYTGGVPVGSEVKKFDGIVGALMRVIKANPEAYGFDGDTDIGQELFAKKLAMQMASKEGIVNNDWLSDKSIGNLYVIPERDGDSWKLTFVDKDMHKLSFDDVREQGYVVKANNARMV